MDALTTTRLLVAEFRVLAQDVPTRLPQAPILPTTVPAAQSKAVEKKRSWLNLSRKKTTTGTRKRTHGSDELDEGAIVVSAGNSATNTKTEKVIVDDERTAADQAICGMRKWLVALSVHDPAIPVAEYNLQVTTTCRLLLDAAREQFEAVAESGAVEPFATTSESAKIARKSTGGLLRKFSTKSSGSGGSLTLDTDEDEILDAPDDASLALNTLSDILEVSTALAALPMAFVESIISLCFEELNLSTGIARRAAAVRCLVVISSRVDALSYLCSSILLVNLQNKLPFPRFSHLFKFGFDSSQRAMVTLKLFSAINAAMPKLEIDKTEVCLVLTSILRCSYENNRVPFLALDKKTQDLFVLETKLCCEALLKWSKKRVEPLRMVQMCFAHAITVWISVSSSEKDLAECLEMRKTLIVDKIMPALKEDTPFALKLAAQLLHTEAKLSLFQSSEPWRSQTMGKLFPALLKCGMGPEVQDLLVSAIRIQPEFVVGEWMTSTLFPASSGQNHDGSKLLFAVSSLAVAFTKGGVTLRPDIAAALISKHLEPVLFDERLKASALSGSNINAAVERTASTATSVGTGSKDEDELEEQNDEELGLDIPMEILIPEPNEPEEIEVDTTLPPPPVSANNQEELFFLLAVQVLRLFPLVFPPTERYLNQLALLGLYPSSSQVAASARQSLLALPQSVRDDVVRAKVHALATAELDAAMTMYGLRTLFELMHLEGVSPIAKVTGMGVVLFHYHASTSRSMRIEILKELSAQPKANTAAFVDDRDVKAEARALARARIRPFLRNLTKMTSKSKVEKRCREFYGAMKCICATSGPVSTESAELNAVLSTFFQDLLLLPGWLINRLVSAIQFCLPANCEPLAADALRYRITSNAPPALPGVEGGGGAMTYLHPRFIYVLNAILTAASSNVTLNATRVSTIACNALSESSALLLNSFATQLLSSNSFSGFYTPSSEEFVWRCYRLLNSFVGLSVVSLPSSSVAIATLEQADAVEKIARLVLNSPKGGKATEAMKIDVIGSLTGSPVCVPFLGLKSRTAFVEMIAQWWNQIATVSNAPTSVSDTELMGKDFVRACKALKSLLQIAASKTSQETGSNDGEDHEDAHDTVLQFVERALRDPGPVGSLRFSAVIAWMETLNKAPQKDIVALLVVMILTQRRNPPDALHKFLACAQDWLAHENDSEGHSSVSGALRFALMSADEVVDHSDVGVATAASRAIAERCALLKIDPTTVVEQAGLVAGKLFPHQCDAVLRAILVVVEPWIQINQDRSPRFAEAIWILSENVLSSRSSSAMLRPMVLELWRTAARSAGAGGHAFLFDILLKKAVEEEKADSDDEFAVKIGALVLQAWRAIAPYCKLTAIAGAVFLKVNECYSNRKPEIPALVLELAACALRYGEGKDKEAEELMAWYLGRLAHFACISEAHDARSLAMRTLQRFLGSQVAMEDAKLREMVLKAVAKHPLVMASAVDSALGWVRQFEDDDGNGNLDLAAVSVVFIMELHSKNVSGSSMTSTQLPDGGLATICRCAIKFMRSSTSKQHSSSTGQRQCASLVRSVLRFGCFLRLESVHEQRLLGGFAGVCLHASPADTQFEAGSVLKEELPIEVVRSAQRWFCEVLAEIKENDLVIDEMDGVVQFIATAGGEKLKLDDLIRVLGRWKLDSPNVLHALEAVRAVLQKKAYEARAAITVDDAFVDVCSALLYWEDATIRAACLEVLGTFVQSFKNISNTVACRVLRCSMNELIASSSSSDATAHLAERVLKKGVGLDDGFSVVPPALTSLFQVTVPSVLSCLERVVQDDATCLYVPPVPPSRQERVAAASSPSVEQKTPSSSAEKPSRFGKEAEGASPELVPMRLTMEELPIAEVLEIEDESLPMVEAKEVEEPAILMTQAKEKRKSVVVDVPAVPPSRPFVPSPDPPPKVAEAGPITPVKSSASTAIETPIKKPELPPGKPVMVVPGPTPPPSRPPRPSIVQASPPGGATVNREDATTALQKKKAPTSAATRSEEELDRRRKVVQVQGVVGIKDPEPEDHSKPAGSTSAMVPPSAAVMQEMKKKLSGSENEPAEAPRKSEATVAELDHHSMQRPVIPRGKRRMPSSMKDVLSELGPEIRAMKQQEQTKTTAPDDDDDLDVDL